MRLGLALACAGIQIVGSGLARAQGFHDDFNGTELDPSVWSADMGSGGQIVVANGVVTLSCTGSTFPVVTTQNDPFPPGDFRLRVGMQYLGNGNCGDGFGAMDNFWENYHGQNVCRPFLLWQDGAGLYVYTGSAGATGLAPPPETGYHIFEWVYMGGVYDFFMDGVLRASGGCAPKATSIFFGHPHPIGCVPWWSSFAIDFIDVSSIGVTPTRSPSWGGLKLIYR